MTKDQLGGLIRTILAFLGGFLVSKGWIDNETLTTLISAVATAGVAIWSWYTNRPSKIVETTTALPKDIPGAQAAKAAVQ